MKRSVTTRVVSAALLVLGLIRSVAVTYADPTPISGAIFTTILPCDQAVNRNIYAAKSDVYINGGPARPGAAGLPPGNYYVRVTAPSANDPTGQVLGTSVLGPFGDTPVTVTAGGDFAACYQLTSILRQISDSLPGYDNTPNPGGEYKVWVCQDANFTPSLCKTDNFKVRDNATTGTLNVLKYYDANANGLDDDGAFNALDGWQVSIDDGIHLVRLTPVSVGVDSIVPYTVTESSPVETNWVSTTQNPVTGVTVPAGGATTVKFGNVCLGEGGGLTLGFWSNKNGQTVFNSKPNNLSAMVSLNLRDAAGANFDPGSYTAFRTWILGADAVNMAYMLSAQLAATDLNVLNGRVTGTSLVYAPALKSYNVTGETPLGFISINDLIAAANSELGAHGYTPSGNASRAYQEALKNALDDANNNKNFVQTKPCDFSFAAS